MMNKTELKAKIWLDAQGYTKLIFQPQHSPDILTGEGIGFEVKLIRNNVIFFSSRQWDELESHPNVNILAFGESEKPEAIIAFADLTKPPSYWRQYRLAMADLTKGRYLAYANKIMEVRLKLGLSQPKLARKLGVSLNTIHRWEAGRCKPSPLALTQLNKLLKATK